MTPQLLRVGEGAHPVVILDGATGRHTALIEMAAAMAPLPLASGVHYPGLRRVIDECDAGAFGYVRQLLEDAAQFIAGAFDIERFHLVEASFSMVTTPPGRLSAVQRAPHFDSVDPHHLAGLHYLGGLSGSGTAFYRHRATGIEHVDAGNVARYVAAIRQEAAARSGYAGESDGHYERIAAVEAVPDRLILYRGGLLHSGLIPAGMAFSENPREGRLTANFFLQGD